MPTSAELVSMARCFSELKNRSDLLSPNVDAGWLYYQSLPEIEGLLNNIIDTAADVRAKCDIFIVVGIGGSHTGCKAVIDALSPHLGGPIANRGPKIVYAGQNLSAEYLSEVLEILKNSNVCINIVSKSGSTVETDVAARLLITAMKAKYGDEAADRIYVTTDDDSSLYRASRQNGWKLFTMPRGIGGRYSVFTPAGLFPIAVAGIDIREFIEGARTGEKLYGNGCTKNPALLYAAARNHLDKNGKDVELFAVYEPRHRGIATWWVQLFGESCGKDGVGLFPADVNYTGDLHSVGQFVQEGRRSLFETVLWCGEDCDLKAPAFESAYGVAGAADELAGVRVADICRAAYLGTMLAHTEGGVPCIGIELLENSAKSIGELLYFFMVAVSYSALAQGLNPFDQPGVEAYKKNMRRIIADKD